MADKEFIVSHGRARAPITIRGKNLKEALEKERLDPNIWKLLASPGSGEIISTTELEDESVPD